ncbi:MAG: hypothetical protein ACJ764_13280 [Solirubrobacteraceae bacterium]
MSVTTAWRLRRDCRESFGASGGGLGSEADQNATIPGLRYTSPPLA